MIPWEVLERARGPDGVELELRRRGDEYLVRAGGRDLMSSEDERSSRALAELGCADLDRASAVRVLVGGLGLGYTLRAALDCMGPNATVEVAELVPAVVQWSRTHVRHLARAPLEDPRTAVRVEDVALTLGAAAAHYDTILLDVDNGPDALVHEANEALYGPAGLRVAKNALRPRGVLAVWSFSDDPEFTRKLRDCGFTVQTHRVPASRKGRGRHHVIWVARRDDRR